MDRPPKRTLSYENRFPFQKKQRTQAVQTTSTAQSTANVDDDVREVAADHPVAMNSGNGSGGSSQLFARLSNELRVSNELREVREGSIEIIDRQVISDEDRDLQANPDEDINVQANPDEERNVQANSDEERNVHANSDEERNVQANANEDRNVQANANEAAIRAYNIRRQKIESFEICRIVLDNFVNAFIEKENADVNAAQHYIDTINRVFEAVKRDFFENITC